MCRKCGEPDRRGSASSRRRRRQQLVDGDGLVNYGGNGVITACIWCGCLVGLDAGSLHAAGDVIEIRRLEQDRIEAGGPYAIWNLAPACAPCNRARTYREQDIPEGCSFGNGRRLLAKEHV